MNSQAHLYLEIRNAKIKMIEAENTELKFNNKSSIVEKQISTVNEMVQDVKQRNQKLKQENSKLKDQILRASVKMDTVILENVGYLSVYVNLAKG